jgi:hypothetical protein
MNIGLLIVKRSLGLLTLSASVLLLNGANPRGAAGAQMADHNSMTAGETTQAKIARAMSAGPLTVGKTVNKNLFGATNALGDVFEFAYRQTGADNRFIPTDCRCDECGPALHLERCHDHGLADAHLAKGLHKVDLYAKSARNAKPEPHVWRSRHHAVFHRSKNWQEIEDQTYWDFLHA